MEFSQQLGRDVTGGGDAATPAGRRPNVLFLMSDEHRADVTGYEGNPVIRTPVLDRLAATGVVFRNAYTPAPICMPGRQSLLAGQLPMTTGCLRYGEDLPPGHMTFARRFAQYAYATVACGKLHHTGPDQLQGWTQRVCGDIGVGAQHIPDRDEASFAAQMLKASLVQPHYPYTTDEEKFAYYLNRVRPYLDQPVSAHPFLSRRQVRPGVDASERELRRATAAYYGMVETMDAHFGTVLEALGSGPSADPADVTAGYAATPTHGA